MFKKTLITVLLLVSFTYASEVNGWTIPKSFPKFRQCDSRWGHEIMVNKTICKVGCLMSSVAMALNGFGYKINGKTANPSTLNTFLQKNGGYVGNQLLVYAAVCKINPKITFVGMYKGVGSVSRNTIKNYLDSKKYAVIGHVRSGSHYVLIDGYSSDLNKFHVLEPAYADDSYNYNNIVGYRIYKMA
ncbi:hypothetical protein P9112_012223 [Eukaryota sp. TZLM1-RC]